MDYGTVDGVINAAIEGEITGKRALDVVANSDAARACYEIAITQTNVPVKFENGDPNPARLRDVLGGLRFHSLNNDKVVRRMTR